MAPSNTIPVVVVVPPRPEPHKGFYSLGRSRPGKGVFFPSGTTEIDVTPEELKELQEEAAEKVIPDSSVEGGKRRVPGFLTVLELDPATAARNRAATAEKAAKDAEAAAEKAIADAQARADAAKAAAAAAAAFDEKAKGKAK